MQLSDLCIFTEPQQGASYDTLLAVAQRAEALGFGGFFRSDHYLKMGSVSGLPGPSDAWITLAGLAIAASAVPRSELFVTTKLWNSDQGTQRAFDAFDVAGLTRQLVQAHVPYFILTIGQNSGFYLSPNRTYDEIAGIWTMISRLPSTMSSTFPMTSSLE